MPTSLSQTLTDIRLRLDSTNSATSFWSDTELTTWINEACRDLARRTESLLGQNSTIFINGQSTFQIPSDAIRVHQIFFYPTTSTFQYPVKIVDQGTFTSMVGINPNLPGAYPQIAYLWDNPPSITATVYPVPYQGGLFQVYYYRSPVPVFNTTDFLDIVDGWEDLVSLYVEYVALRKGRDPRWSDSKALYDQNVEVLINRTRTYSDASGMINTGNQMIPGWLYGGDW